MVTDKISHENSSIIAPFGIEKPELVMRGSLSKFNSNMSQDELVNPLEQIDSFASQNGSLKKEVKEDLKLKNKRS